MLTMLWMCLCVCACMYLCALFVVGECVKCFASICRFMFATWKCCQHTHTHTNIVLLHCEWSVNRMSTLYLTRLNESGSGSTAIYLDGTNSDVMRCLRRRRVMSLSDSAARTQGKARVDRERVKERRLCVHLGLNVIRTPRRARHKTNDKQLFVRECSGSEWIGPICRSLFFDLSLLLPLLLLTRFITSSQCIWVFQLFES